MSDDFELDVMEKLGRIEAKLGHLCGNGQPGKVQMIENRLAALEKNDWRRTWIERTITGAISFAVAAVVTVGGWLFKNGVR